MLLEVERGSRPISSAYKKKETHLCISYVPQQNLLYQMSAKSHISNYEYVSSDQNPCDLWHEPWNPGVLIGICIMGFWTNPNRTG